jgi:hypothetical protein
MNKTNLTELVSELDKSEDDKGVPYMSPQFRHLVQAGLHHVHLPDNMHGAAAESLQAVFEGMGGMPRMLLWADEHPSSFYKLFARMVIPTIAPVLPQATAQELPDPPWLTARRLAYQESGFNPLPGDDDVDAMDNLE